MRQITRVVLFALCIAAATAILTPSQAQTANQMTIRLRTSTYVPRTVTGFRLETVCYARRTGAGVPVVSTRYTSEYPVNGGTATISLAPEDGACAHGITPIGDSQAKRRVSFVWNGQLQPVPFLMLGVIDGSDVREFAIEYPGIRVAAALFGTEPSPGSSSRFAIECSTPASGSVGTFNLIASQREAFTFGAPEFPNMDFTDTCVVKALETNGMEAKLFVGTAEGTTVNGVAQSPPAQPGQAVTALLQSFGEVYVAVEATNEPSTQSYEISIACDQAGPKEIFVLKSGEYKVFRHAAGANCLVTQLSKNGSVVVYEDNYSDSTDGRVVLPARMQTCAHTPTFGNVLRIACTVAIVVRNTFPVSPTTTAPTTTTTTASTTTTTTTAPTTPTTTTTAPTTPTTTTTAPTTTTTATIPEPVRVSAVAAEAASSTSSPVNPSIPSAVMSTTTRTPVTPASTPTTGTSTVAPKSVTSSPETPSSPPTAQPTSAQPTSARPVSVKTVRVTGGKPGGLASVYTSDGKLVARMPSPYAFQLPPGKYRIVVIMNDSGRKSPTKTTRFVTVSTPKKT